MNFIITVLVIYGVHASTREGMIFNRIWWLCFRVLNRFSDRPEWYMKPLFDCTPCMASIYGGTSYLILYGLDIGIVVWVFSMTGFNYLLNRIIK